MDDLGGFGRRSVAMMVEVGEASTRPAEPPEFSVAGEKYVIEGRVGGGGMGEVLLVEDRDLRRQIAMKVLREEISSPDSRLKFVAEAQATSQLEHPGIPPVHDMGVTPSGRIYFTMKLVRGRTLKDVLKDLLLGVKPVRQEYSLHKLVTVLERVAEALHFAHEKGVIHRDLKPENIMLGEYGEVHVMDWGIAKISALPEEEALEDAVLTAGTDSGMTTLDGTVKGTIPYMSPEQASGRVSALDRRSDVYALGCLLYEMLTLHPAFDGHDIGTLVLVRKGEFLPVGERNARRPVPKPLADICTTAMALDPADRPESAGEFGSELRAWLDGRREAERRHREAEVLAERGKAAAVRFERLKGEVKEADRAAETVEKDFNPWQPVAEKRPLIEAREQAESLKTELVQAFAESVKLLEGALLSEDDNRIARSALAALWAGRLSDLEVDGQDADKAYALEMIRRYDDGSLAPVISGEGTLELASEPAGAEVLLSRLVERDGVLVPTEERPLGPTPIAPEPLAMGSYLAVLRSPGCRDVRYPVHISRNRTWQGTVRLRTGEEIGEGFVCVPGGPFVYGLGRDLAVRELPDFAIAEYPVTFGEYLEFLSALTEEEAEQRKPRTPGDGAFVERGEDGIWRTLPVIVEGKARERCEAAYGKDFELQIPVMGVSFHDAVAYCAWKTRTTGKTWRLPTEEEREKAARGVDGRQFPWGRLADASLGKCRDSRDEPAQPEPIGAFPTAASIYRMGDAAGNVWDWTDSWYDERREWRVLRGGSWHYGWPDLRCGFRDWFGPDFRATHIGFRCARDLS